MRPYGTRSAFLGSAARRCAPRRRCAEPRKTDLVPYGFTLAEVAVTIVIVGIGMLLVLQGLNTAKLTAAHTRNTKLARELALTTLGQIASGQFQEDIQDGLDGSYAEEGYPEFSFEVVVGDDSFRETTTDGPFDSWAPRDDRREEDEDEEKDPQEETDEPFEKVKIKITFPKIDVAKEQLKNELVLEEWIPWKQVYGQKEEAEAAADAGSAPAPGAAGGTGK